MAPFLVRFKHENAPALDVTFDGTCFGISHVQKRLVKCTFKSNCDICFGEGC